MRCLYVRTKSTDSIIVLFIAHIKCQASYMSIYSRTAWTSTRRKHEIYMTYAQHKVFASYQNSLKLIDLSCRTTYGWGTPYLTCVETDSPSVKLMAILAKLNIKYNVQE